jgi:hypothetical protein
MKKKYAWLILGAVCCFFFWLTRYCPDELSAHAGKYPSYDAGDRASLKMLSDEIKSCPNAKKYTVRWLSFLPKHSIYEPIDMRYDPATKVLMIINNPDSNTGWGYDKVTKDDIHKVAGKNGQTKDLKHKALP